MKRFVLFLLGVSVFSFFSARAEEADVHRFATFNVRYVNSDNGDTGDKYWGNRRWYVVQIIKDYDFDIDFQASEHDYYENNVLSYLFDGKLYRILPALKDLRSSLSASLFQNENTDSLGCEVFGGEEALFSDHWCEIKEIYQWNNIGDVTYYELSNIIYRDETKAEQIGSSFTKLTVTYEY